MFLGKISMLKEVISINKLFSEIFFCYELIFCSIERETRVETIAKTLKNIAIFNTNFNFF